MTGANAQAGITARPTEHLLTAALTFTQADASSCRVAVEALREVVRRELSGDLDEIVASTPKQVPTSETGELGVSDQWNPTGLTIDVGFSAAGYDALGVVTPNRPSDLEEVPWADFGMAPASPTSGHMLLHIRANDLFVAEHVLRCVEHSLVAQFVVTWTLSGTQRFAPQGQHVGRDGRAMIGFHDGLSNLNPSNADDARLIFVDPSAVATYPPTPPPGPQNPQPGQPGYDPGNSTVPSFPTTLRPAATSEPAWTADGSYMFIRGSLLNIPEWDRETLQTQEQAVGRFKSSGAFLDNEDTSANRDAPPQFATTSTTNSVSLNSHVRRANPRSQPSDADRRVLRRGYPLMAATGTGSIQRGLLFVSFSRTLTTQIEFVMKAWLANRDFPSPGAGTDPLLNSSRKC